MAAVEDDRMTDVKLENVIVSHEMTDELGIAVGVIEVGDVDVQEVRVTFPSSLNEPADLASDVSNADQPQEPDADQYDDTSESYSNVRWTDQLTKLLLKKRLPLENEFEKSSKKRKLWEDVSKLLESHDYKVSPEECDKKYRNLLVTYRKNKLKADRSGRRTVSWPYYDMMDKGLSDRTMSTKSETTLSATPIRVLKCSTTSLPHSTGRSTTVFIESDMPANRPLKKRKLRLIKAAASDDNGENPPKWFITFMEKIKQQEEERQKKEEARWAELTRIEKEKILAIKDLINAIKSKS